VLEFYCEQSVSAAHQMDPFRQGLAFTMTATSHYKTVDSHGRVTGVDTAVVQYWFSSGSLDSQVVRSATSESNRLLQCTPPDIFTDRYLYAFYPNDTGGEELAIGFDTPSADDSLPVGLVVIDRDRYLPRRLYLHYPNRPGYKRFSLCYRMSEQDGYLFTDSIWEVGAKEGIFTTENYRLETRIDTVRILRP